MDLWVARDVEEVIRAGQVGAFSGVVGPITAGATIGSGRVFLSSTT